MKLTREIKTGILAIVAIALLIFGYQFLQGKNLLSSDRTFYVIYDNVEGLSTSSPVTVNGMQVGHVMEIGFGKTSGELVVKLLIDNQFSFSKNSIAKIYGGGLIGGKSLSINPVYDRSTVAKDGDTLVGEVEEGLIELVNDRLTPLQGKIEMAIVSADSVLTAVNNILSQDSRTNLQSVFEDLSTTMRSLKNTAGTLDQVLAVNKPKLNNIFVDLEKTSGNFTKTSEAIAEVDFKKMIANLESSTRNLRIMTEDLQNGRGSAGKLLNDDQLYNNLTGASEEMAQLLEDLKENPKRYVHFSLFGKKPKPYKDPDEDAILD